jgi:hypothetical protein
MFYEFPNEIGTMFKDEHFKTAHQAEWLTDQLLPKLLLAPNTELYQTVIDQTEKVFDKIPSEARFKKHFELKLFQEQFNLPRWPNMVQGFYYFKDDTGE